MANNFRKAYYSSLGVQVVEVKPSLETALQGDILDVERLNKLCLWVRIPHSYRPIVWKVLLGTISLAKEVWPFVDQQREEQYTDLKRCVSFLGPYREDDDLTADCMVSMLLVKMDARLPHSLPQAYLRSSLPDLVHLRALAVTMLEVCDTSEADAYWLFESFVRRYHVSLPGGGYPQEEERIKAEIRALENLLKAQNGPLLEHIRSFGKGLEVYCHG
ncbi:TBC1 domain member 7 [Thoreauomyces humboldtii]|nr:TBC1 domain member 7 [Thoreauomyces humboldtii]